MLTPELPAPTLPNAGNFDKAMGLEGRGQGGTTSGSEGKYEKLCSNNYNYYCSIKCYVMNSVNPILMLQIQ